MEVVCIFKPRFHTGVQKTSQHGKNVSDQVDFVS